MTRSTIHAKYLTTTKTEDDEDRRRDDDEAQRRRRRGTTREAEEQQLAGEKGTEAQDRARSSLWCFVSTTTNTNTHRNFLSASVVVARLTVTCARHPEEDYLLRQSELDSWLVGSLVRLLGEKGLDRYLLSVSIKYLHGSREGGSHLWWILAQPTDQ